MKPTHDDLHDLLGLTVEVLKLKLKDGSATAADLNVARQLLKDNGVGLTPVKTDVLGELRDALPFQAASEVAEEQQFFN